MNTETKNDVPNTAQARLAKVYSILKQRGLIAPKPLPEYPAKREWQHKTTHPNEIWQLDGTNLFIVGWGYYILLPILDDFSRKIISWVLMPDETGVSASGLSTRKTPRLEVAIHRRFFESLKIFSIRLRGNKFSLVRERNTPSL